MKAPSQQLAVIGLCALGAVFLLVSTAAGQSMQTEHVMTLDDPGERPRASLGDISWLAGAWTGEAFGGTFEEVWTRPSGGTMMGMFKLENDGSPSFYELQLIAEEEESLVWKVKHFSSDFTSWEEKAEFLSFPLVKITSDAAYFDGITLVRQNDSLATVYLASKTDGRLSESRLTYRRRR